MYKFLLVAAISAGAAFGSTFTYNYTGTPLTKCGSGACPANYASDYDVVSLSLGNPLASGLVGANVSSSLTSWTSGDALGQVALSSTGAVGTQSFLLSTNAGGSIVGYQILTFDGGTNQAGSSGVFINNPLVVGGGSGQLFADALNYKIQTPAGYATSSGLTGTWTEKIDGLVGGTSSAPVFLLGGEPVTDVTGSIGNSLSQEYYAFNWGGGTLSVSAAITGADPLASFQFTGGGSNSCTNLSSTTLNTVDGFKGTLTIQNLAPGQYCIGLDAALLSDPNFDLTFNTPVNNTPEPGSVLLLASSVVLFVLLRRKTEQV